MTTNTSDRQLTWVPLAIVTALVVLPALTMGVGMMGTSPMLGGAGDHGMWGASDGESGWPFVVDVAVRISFLVALIGAGYLGYREITGGRDSSDPTIEELRTADARGELSEDEYEQRRARLQAGQ